MLIREEFARIACNPNGRDFLVGDLHGQADLLNRALILVGFSPDKDRVIALGDLIDRGPDSAWLLQQLRSNESFISVRGNHEAMLLRAVLRGGRELWDENGNEWSHALDHHELNELGDIVDGMPIAAELCLRDGRRIGLVHAEVAVGRGWEDIRVNHARRKTDVTSALWGRRRLNAWERMAQCPTAIGLDPLTRVSSWNALQPISGIDSVVSGHTIVAKRIPVAFSNMIFIDTGAYEPGGRLTIVDILEGLYWQVGRRQGKPHVIRNDGLPLPTARHPLEAWRPDQYSLDIAAQVAGADMDFLAGMGLQ